MTVDVLGFHDNATVYCAGVCVAPSPANDWFTGALDALLINEMLPADVPPDGGEKVTVYVALFPAATVIGNVIPLTEYPEPFQAADETTTSALEADKEPIKDELLPTFTFPKFSVDGETAKVPTLLLPFGWL